jgi:hypothetical protein
MSSMPLYLEILELLEFKRINLLVWIDALKDFYIVRLDWNEWNSDEKS